MNGFTVTLELALIASRRYGTRESMLRSESIDRYQIGEQSQGPYFTAAHMGTSHLWQFYEYSDLTYCILGNSGLAKTKPNTLYILG